MWWYVFDPCQYFVSVVAFKLLNTEASKSGTGHQLSVRSICGELKWRSRLLKCFSQTAFGQTEITFPSVRACGMKQSLVHQQVHPHTHGFQTNTVFNRCAETHSNTHMLNIIRQEPEDFLHPTNVLPVCQMAPVCAENSPPSLYCEQNIKRSNGHQSPTRSTISSKLVCFSPSIMSFTFHLL